MDLLFFQLPPQRRPLLHDVISVIRGERQSRLPQHLVPLLHGQRRQLARVPLRPQLGRELGFGDSPVNDLVSKADLRSILDWSTN